VVNACGFINYDKWQTYPFLLKGSGDRAFCEGINRIFLPAFAHQPDLNARPGLRPMWGSILDRNTTWWEQSRAWLHYLARCSYLLQQGLPVADVCCFRGEGPPFAATRFRPHPLRLRLR